MSRTLSAHMIKNAFKQEAQDYPVFLFTVTHDSLSTPLRFCSDWVEDLVIESQTVGGVNSRGNDFLFVPMSFKLPGESEDGIKSASIVIDNADRAIVPSIRSIYTPPTVLMEIVMASTPDTLEASWPGLRAVNPKYNVDTIEIELQFELLDTEPLPYGSFTPNYFPGLYKGGAGQEG